MQMQQDNYNLFLIKLILFLFFDLAPPLSVFGGKYHFLKYFFSAFRIKMEISFSKTYFFLLNLVSLDQSTCSNVACLVLKND